MVSHSWGRCYHHNFQRFFPILGKKWRFSQKTMLGSIFMQKLALIIHKVKSYHT
jgi:hypothetical protein